MKQYGSSRRSTRLLRTQQNNTRKSPGRSPNRKSPGRSPNRNSPGRSPTRKSPGRSPNRKSPGRSPTIKSPGRSPTRKSPARSPTRQSPTRQSPSKKTAKKPRDKLGNEISNITSSLESIGDITNENIIVIYPGRFQLFHKGHKGVYDKLRKGFNFSGHPLLNNVFIFTAGFPKTMKDKSKYPFNFEEKKSIMTDLVGISDTHIIDGRAKPTGKSPSLYGKETVQNHILKHKLLGITKESDFDDKIFLFVVGEKDMIGTQARFKFGKNLIELDRSNLPKAQQKLRLKRNNYNNSYVKSAKNINTTRTFKNFSYILQDNTKSFMINDEVIEGATQLRNMLKEDRDTEEDTQKYRYDLLNQLYDRTTPNVELYDLMINRIVG